MAAGHLVLPRDDLVEALDLNQPKGCGELAHPLAEALDAVIRLSVVAVGTGELHEVVVGRHKHAALAGRDRLRCVKGVDAGVAPAPRPATVPAGAVRVGAVL